jgi:hypothetical protein
MDGKVRKKTYLYSGGVNIIKYNMELLGNVANLHAVGRCRKWKRPYTRCTRVKYEILDCEYRNMRNVLADAQGTHPGDPVLCEDRLFSYDYSIPGVRNVPAA